MSKFKALQRKMLEQKYQRAERYLLLAAKELHGLRVAPYRNDSGKWVFDTHHVFIQKDVRALLADVRRHKARRFDEVPNVLEVEKQARQAAA